MVTAPLTRGSRITLIFSCLAMASIISVRETLSIMNVPFSAIRAGAAGAVTWPGAGGVAWPGAGAAALGVAGAFAGGGAGRAWGAGGGSGGPAGREGVGPATWAWSIAVPRAAIRPIRQWHIFI